MFEFILHIKSRRGSVDSLASNMASLKLYFALLAFSVFSSSNGFIRMPLKRHHQRHHNHQPSSAKPFTVGLSVNCKAEFYTTVQIGDRGQEFKLLLDSGSSSVVIASTDCAESCGKMARHSCPGPLQGTAELLYGSGVATCNICSDSLTIGGHNIRNQTLYLATDLYSIPFDGILGLAYSSVSTYTSNTGEHKVAPTIVDNLAAQYGVRKIYSTYLTIQPNHEGSFVLFGGSDKNYYKGKLQYVPLSRHSTASFSPYDAFRIQASFKFGQDTLAESIFVVIDTGSSVVFLREDIYNDINNKIQSPGGDLIDCSVLDQLPPFKMQAGNVSLQLEAKYFVSDDSCELKIAPWYGNTIIMGIPFFQKYYVEFDMEENRIGFAEKKNIF